MKKLSLLLFLFSSFCAFTKGKLLFVSNIHGELKLDGVSKSYLKSGEYRTFTLIEGSHSVEFYYQNQKVLDTIVSIVYNNQSLVKLNFILPKSNTKIEKDIVLNTNDNTKIIYHDSLTISKNTINPSEISKKEVVSFLHKTELVNENKNGFYTQNIYQLEENQKIEFEVKHTLRKFAHLVNEIDMALFENRDDYQTFLAIVDLETQNIVFKKELKMDADMSFEFVIPKSGVYGFRTHSVSFNEEVNYTLSSNVALKNLNAFKIEKDLQLAQFTFSKYSQKDILTFELPQNTKTWSYYITTEQNLDLESIKTKTANGVSDQNLKSVLVFDPYFNQRFLSGSQYIKTYKPENYDFTNNGQFTPNKNKLSMGITYMKNKKRLPTYYVYILSYQEVSGI
jgi:hypothetical protein